MARKFGDDEMWVFSESHETGNSSQSVDVEVFWRQLTEKRDRWFELPGDDVWLSPDPLKSPQP